MVKKISFIGKKQPGKRKKEKEQKLLKEMKKKINVFILIGILLIVGLGFFYFNFIMGDYIIQEQWINSSYEGKFYCDNCLWIRFSEGCNRYPVYYFENQHELDNRFNYGDVVNINFRNVNGKEYVKSVNKAIKYRFKC